MDRDPDSDPACVLAVEHYNTACDSGQEPWQAAKASFEFCWPSFQDTEFAYLVHSHTAFASIAARDETPTEGAGQCLRLFIKNAWQYCHLSEMGVGAEEDAAADQYLNNQPRLPDGQ